MNNIKLFPNFELTLGSSNEDKLFLEELKSTKSNTEATFVNFSFYEYNQDNVATTHYITYPIDWVTSYIKDQFIDIDPLFKLDYRLVSIADWHDIQSSYEAQKLFEKFSDRGLGNCGITIANNLSKNCYGVMSLSFLKEHDEWLQFRKQNLPNFKLLNEQLSRKYNFIYNDTPLKKYSITTREKECIYWIAMGKTDDQISKLLSIGKWTVVAHIKSAKYKLKCSNRASAVAKAISLQIINIENEI